MNRIIVFVVGKDPLFGPAGGHNSFVRAHARAAVRAGFEPHLFCIGNAKRELRTDFGLLHTIHSRLRLGPNHDANSTTVPWHAPPLAAAVERFLELLPGPHLIHSFSIWGYAGYQAASRLVKKGIQVFTMVNVYTTLQREFLSKVRGLRPYQGFRSRMRIALDYQWVSKVVRPLERIGYQKSDLVLINYETVGRFLHLDVDPRLECRKIIYAPETAFLSPDYPETSGPPPGLASLKPSGAPLILAVSRHDPRKGVDLLLEALGKLRQRGKRFRACLVGGGALLKYNRELADQFHLGESTILTGEVPDVQSYFREADIFVLPSLEEHSGSLSMLEALQAGVAITASGVDGIPEDVTNGRTALLVPPGDADALALALERLLQDRDLRRQLGRNGRLLYEARFSADRLSAALGEIYGEFGFRPEA